MFPFSPFFFSTPPRPIPTRETYYPPPLYAHLTFDLPFFLFWPLHSFELPSLKVTFLALHSLPLSQGPRGNFPFTHLFVCGGPGPFFPMALFSFQDLIAVAPTSFPPFRTPGRFTFFSSLFWDFFFWTIFSSSPGLKALERDSSNVGVVCEDFFLFWFSGFFCDSPPFSVD